MLRCDETCVDPLYNPNHCGECDNACCAGEVCSDGECGLSCGGVTPMLWGDCDDVCDIPGSIEYCLAGECGVAECSPGPDDCNDDYDDGCEIDLNNNLDLCGSWDMQGCMPDLSGSPERYPWRVVEVSSSSHLSTRSSSSPIISTIHLLT